ncbi:Uncharacterised protein [Mycobacteroides abscessus subsp. massiliense]|uniref:hypothetical protein n=1 Tax=Mycobacteroides abscessus TaxID=36809 RepID=UPI0009A6CE46|nr:hypothetical protein [Mycobacteroides abscessus]SKM81958.1 Uncharacterised protein [Mycobacteroides abscessus subsp. massiliense]SKM98653.1 Uncharacterised protein [Mycobacteroides abscessus subsp. massiliense]SKN77319.1 Uncharacterised protein [Mycobacteroides abscessus subsp. massiliense]SKN95841.1 Uncharacterised protein [Mycobacteroides abscessus subsp. massiliense]SKO22575.1 Uncharacterised protein [Mycobacteroides abscessus subsp. massiliense]
MSGGSFDYLYCKDLDDVLGAMGSLHEMADTLDASFPGSRAARDTRALVDRFNQLHADWEAAPLKDLRSVWHAVEWWKSCDWSRDRAQKAVDEYRSTWQGLIHWVPR